MQGSYWELQCLLVPRECPDWALPRGVRKKDSALVCPELEGNPLEVILSNPSGCLGPGAHDHAQDTEGSSEALSWNPELNPELSFDFNRVQNIGIVQFSKGIFLFCIECPVGPHEREIRFVHDISVLLTLSCHLHKFWKTEKCFNYSEEVFN